MTDKEKEIFLKYLREERKGKEEVRNYKNRKLVFYEEIDGKGYYIKKYIPKKSYQYKITLGIKEDPAVHCKNICKELAKINVPCIEPYFIKIYKKSLFRRVSIFVTKDCGEPLGNYLTNFKEHKKWFDYFFAIFLHLAQNKIYCTDYNIGGLLIGKDGILRLIDFDSYRRKNFLTKSYKRYIIENLEKQAYTNKEEYKEYDEYAREKVKDIIKKLGWEKDIY